MSYGGTPCLWLAVLASYSSYSLSKLWIQLVYLVIRFCILYIFIKWAPDLYGYGHFNILVSEAKLAKRTPSSPRCPLFDFFYFLLARWGHFQTKCNVVAPIQFPFLYMSVSVMFLPTLKRSAGERLPLISFVLCTLGLYYSFIWSCSLHNKMVFLARMVQMLNEGIGQNRKVHGSSGFGTALTTSILSRLLIGKIICNSRSNCKTANSCLVWAGHVFQ